MKSNHLSPFRVLCLFGVTRLRPLLMLLFLTLPAFVQAQFTYTNENDTITITGYTGPDGAVVIPDTIDGLPVTRIGNSAFYFRPGLTSVTIPNSVIGIGEFAFASCWNLTTATIPNRLTSIGIVAFGSCRLTTVSIPNSVTNIGYSAFAGCSVLTNVTIGNGVASIEANTFGSCTNLTSVTIPSSVTSIGDFAFEHCQFLTSITIPNNVTNIGVEAFWACASLTNVYFQGNAPAFVGFDAFAYANNATAYYRPGTTGWGPFSTLPAVLWNPLVETDDGSFGVQANQFGFNITGTADIPILVEASTTLGNANWVPLQSLNLTNGAFYFSDPNWTNYPARNYRIRSP